VVASETATSRKVRIMESDLANQKTNLRAFLVWHGIEESKAAEKAMAYFAFMESTCHGVDEDMYLKDALPKNLYTDFRSLNVHSFITSVPQFNGFSATCLRALMNSLSPRFFTENEWIVTVERPLDGVYFVAHGSVQVLDPETDDLVVAEKDPGTMFGNEGLVLDQLPEVGVVRWHFTAKATAICNTYFLLDVDFCNIVTDQHPGGI
jgi:hypothetical protein